MRARKKKQTLNNQPKKNNNNNNKKTTSFEGGGGTGSDPKFLTISSFCFPFSTVSLLHLSFQEDY